ncbi:MAG: fumarylacetoacetate hydrolase family protein [Acidobacterium ailaaui]|jgi:2-keto-4-pentenoate hydratase/2-oxohepta-3-ene-1,7-dioic acid hydratase in catechol pathway|nr:fumarylacetoacetate hydrolase family protein [Pseudacidobacterium ailaaui]MCL6464250.1 fumarylacetoacetate hydrolase family protein [Pseudacidobacterium ailaaui]MDI3253172.1 fumarylacetoacetate hydrolase family protein [Bacillota bacterium]
MRLVTFAGSDGNPRPGALLNNTVVDLSSRFRSIHSLVLGGEEAIRTAEDLAQSASSRFSLDEVRLLAPIPDPPRIFCIGLNYRDHAVESRMEVPKVPTVFLKLPTALVGHGEAIRLPSISSQPDYEVEFACVIGRDGHRIARENWLDYVFGYTILNDVSARDVQLATSQWVLGKSFPTFAPLGPAIVTKDEIPDPHALDIRLSIDGELLQHSNTQELIFKLPDLIAYLSSIVPLLPGDIISTGTPAGVGLGRTPQRWLKPGETVTCEVAGLGQLVNPVVAGE